MITFTAPDGTPTHIAGGEVVRIRGSYPNESPEAGVRTKIDWVGFIFVREEPDFVAGRVAAELPSLACFALPNRAPVWANAQKALGPVRTVPSERVNGTKSAIMLQGKRQYLSNTPTEVAAIITAAHGTPLPIPAEGIFSDLLATLRNTIASPETFETWD